MKLVLNEDAGAKIEQLRAELQNRGVTSIDCGEIVSLALLATPEQFFKKYVDRVTPLEFLVREALKDPAKMAKIRQVISTRRKRKTESSSPSLEPSGV